MVAKEIRSRKKKSNFILLNKHKEPPGINGTRQKITIRTEREGIEWSFSAARIGSF